MKILVTGGAGFIGFHLCKALLEAGHNVVGLDNLNAYYDVHLKYDRLKELGIPQDSLGVHNKEITSKRYVELFHFIRLDLQDRENLPRLFERCSFDVVYNLAAQAGVRHSIDNPEAYIDSNVVGFLNIMECCRHYGVKKFIYASSSSIYGNSREIPFIENQCTDKPVSLYAATKLSNELIAHSYNHLFSIETIGLRFFTVYGPWGRPDMAIFLFTKAILAREPLNVFNNGNLSRDFTYIDDVVKGLLGFSSIAYSNQNQIFNIGNNKPVALMDFICVLEQELDIKATKNFLNMQDGDVEKTWASTHKLNEYLSFNPDTTIEEGVRRFVLWYKKYYQV